MIYSPPEERPSAVDLITKGSDWSIEINNEIFNLIHEVKKANKCKLLRLLNCSFGKK